MSAMRKALSSQARKRKRTSNLSEPILRNEDFEDDPLVRERTIKAEDGDRLYEEMGILPRSPFKVPQAIMRSVTRDRQMSQYIHDQINAAGMAAMENPMEKLVSLKRKIETGVDVDQTVNGVQSHEDRHIKPETLDLLSGPAVQMVVHYKKTQHNFIIPKQILRHHSRFARTRLHVNPGSKASQQHLHVPGTSREAFITFIDWLYTGGVDVAIGRPSMHHAWFIGLKLDAPLFQNYCLEHILNEYKRRENERADLARYTQKVIECVFETGPKSSKVKGYNAPSPKPLQDLVRDWCVWLTVDLGLTDLSESAEWKIIRDRVGNDFWSQYSGALARAATSKHRPVHPADQKARYMCELLDKYVAVPTPQTTPAKSVQNGQTPRTKKNSDMQRAVDGTADTRSDGEETDDSEEFMEGNVDKE